MLMMWDKFIGNFYFGGLINTISKNNKTSREGTASFRIWKSLNVPMK